MSSIKSWVIGRRGVLAAALVLCFASPLTCYAADPVRVGFALGLTGPNAPNGNQLLQAIEIWHDDVNAKGGLLGRPVELVYYDDQTNPANDPGIYTKLIEVDKVDLLLGPYGTNLAAAAMPVIIQHKLTTISMLARSIGSITTASISRWCRSAPIHCTPSRRASSISRPRSSPR